MSKRHFAKVLSVMDSGMRVVIDKGVTSGVSEGDVFTIVGLGDVIVDQATGQEFEQLEILRGRAKAIHVQESIATLESLEISRSPSERRTIVRDSSRQLGYAGLGLSRATSLFGRTGEEREEIEVGGDVRIRPLNKAAKGDFAIKSR